MTAEPDVRFVKTRKRILVLLVLVTILAIALFFLGALSFFRADEVSEAKARLALYERSLNETLQRFQHLPHILAQNPNVQLALQTDATSFDLNQQLSSFAQSSSLEAIYLLDVRGQVISASNFNKPTSFLGRNYEFRPYFLDSIEGRSGEFFGVGATTGRPGYFVSEPVYDDDGVILGVIAIKLDMSEFQRNWEEGSERVFVSNKDGVIVLSSNPNWLYQTLAPLSSEQVRAIEAGRQFGDQRLEPLDWSVENQEAVRLGGDRFIYANNQATRLGWQVHYLLGEERIFERALLFTAIVGSALVCLILFATFLRSRRIQTALSASQKDRQQLVAVNMQLENTQKELKNTSKLAALGQLSASVTHELGQPISALKNYVTASELSGDLKAGENAKKLMRTIDRMENITRQLRFFTRSDDETFETLDLALVAHNAIELLSHEFAQAQIKIIKHIPDATCFVTGNQLRLEQVVINLLSNAMAAVKNQPIKEIELKLSRQENSARLSITDTGPGLQEKTLEQLQEPFHTTKASGQGMGLGLSIASQIIKEHRGDMRAQSLENGGSAFSILLPLAEVKAHGETEVQTI